MNPSGVVAFPQIRFRVLAVLLACALSACGGHGSSRPASSLSDKDRAALDSYEQIRAALAADDPRNAKKVALAMAAALKPADPKATPPPLYEAVDGVATAAALDLMRQRFKTLSDRMIPLAQGVEGYYVMTCDLPSAGDWIQKSRDVDNPYFGRAMHTVGDLKK